MVASAQSRDCHGRLSLTVDLNEDLAKRRDRFLQLLDMHRRATVDDRSEIGGTSTRALGFDPQALNHRRRKECAHAGMMIAEIEEFMRDRSRLIPEQPAEPRGKRRAVCRGLSHATSELRERGSPVRREPPRSAIYAEVIAMRLPWDSKAPFDRPVVPLVKNSHASTLRVRLQSGRTIWRREARHTPAPDHDPLA